MDEYKDKFEACTTKINWYDTYDEAFACATKIDILE
jgi:hypothetical protein